MRKIYQLKCQPRKSFRSLTEFEIGYLAGLWDGEGCFYFEDVRKGKYRPVAQCGMSEALLFELAKVYGGLIFAHKVKRAPRMRKEPKIQYVWELYSDELKEFLEVIAPKMLFKKDQALLLLEAFSQKGNK